MNDQQTKLSALAQCAYRVRRFALRMGEVQGQGYIGQALGWADVLAVAYKHAMNLRPGDPEWSGRDRFLLSHGHYAIALYAALIEAGEAVVLDDGGETVGFAFYRRFGRGHSIGPVIARDTAAAKALVAHWIGSNAGMFMRIDIPGESGLSDWLEELGLARVSNVLTMVRGAPLAPSKGYHVFAAANQALG